MPSLMATVTFDIFLKGINHLASENANLNVGQYCDSKAGGHDHERKRRKTLIKSRIRQSAAGRWIRSAYIKFDTGVSYPSCASRIIKKFQGGQLYVF